MRKYIYAALLAIPVAASSTNQAAPREDTYKDWVIGCDNIRHCEAVGYHEDNGDAVPVALGLARAAGPGTPLRATLYLSDENVEAIASVAVDVDGWRMTGLPVGKPWTAAHTAAIVPRLLNAEAAVFSSGAKRWRLSLAGAKAALLRMDELQGRLDTPGALIRKGATPEQTVPAPPPAPVLTRARAAVADTPVELPASLRKALPRADCVANGAIRGHRLTRDSVLVLQECSRGAYQSVYQAWTASLKAPHQLKQLKLPKIDGSPPEEVFEPDFDEGVLKSAGKGRGLYDCGIWTEWLWTERGFQLLSHDSASACRGFPGGISVRLWTATRR